MTVGDRSRRPWSLRRGSRRRRRRRRRRHRRLRLSSSLPLPLSSPPPLQGVQGGTLDFRLYHIDHIARAHLWYVPECREQGRPDLHRLRNLLPPRRHKIVAAGFLEQPVLDTFELTIIINIIIITINLLTN